MTPPATATAAARSAGRSKSAQRRASMRHPRRVSGPAGPAPANAAAAAVAAVPAPGIALPRRRPAGPSVQPRRRPARKTTRGSAQVASGVALRTVAAVQHIAGSSALDRLIRGRAWIGLLAFALIGIVTMQLLVLQLNTGVGRTLVRMAALQRQNAQLGIEDSTFSAESRVAPLAVAGGMTLALPGTVHFVASSPSNLARATSVLSTAIQPVVSPPMETSSEEHGGETGETESAATSTTAAATSETSGSSETSAAHETAGSSESSAPRETAGSSETSATSESEATGSTASPSSRGPGG
jgi:cell division protein FtsL